MLAAITALAVGAAVTGHAENERSPNGMARPVYSGTTPEVGGIASTEPGSNVASLNALFAEWDRAGFSTPSKSAQYRVYGRNGYVTTGPGYNYMVSLIRSGVTDIREGRDHDAATKIEKARSLLASSNPRKE